MKIFFNLSNKSLIGRRMKYGAVFLLKLPNTGVSLVKQFVGSTKLQ